MCIPHALEHRSKNAKETPAWQWQARLSSFMTIFVLILALCTAYWGNISPRKSHIARKIRRNMWPECSAKYLQFCHYEEIRKWTWTNQMWHFYYTIPAFNPGIKIEFNGRAEGYKICLKSRKETVLFRPLLSIKKNQIKGKKHTGEERSLWTNLVFKKTFAYEMRSVLSSGQSLNPRKSGIIVFIP